MFRTDRFANTNASKKHSQSVRLTVEALEGRDVPSSLGVTGPFSWDQSSGQSVALGSATNYTEAGGTVYFSATTPTTGNELFRIAGSSAALADDIVSGINSSNPRNLINANGRLFFIATDSAGDSLYMASTTTTVSGNTTKTSVTKTTAVKIQDSPNDVTNIAAIGRDVFMITKSTIGVYRTQYDANGNISVSPITSVNYTSGNSGPVIADQLFDLTDINAINGSIYLTRTQSSEDVSLIQINPSVSDRDDATFSGNIITIPEASRITDLLPVGNALYCQAITPVGGKITVINPAGSALSLLPDGITSGGAMRAVNNFVYFAGTQSGSTELWRTNGTLSGTTLYKDLNGATSSSLDPTTGLSNAEVVNNTLFLAADFAQNTGAVQTFGNPRAYSIPDATPSGIPSANPTPGVVTSNVVISSDYSISSLKIRTNLTHTTLSNLKIELIAPSGTPFTLFDGNGFAGDNLVNTVFDDMAAQSIGQGTAPFTGSYRPITALSALAGTSSKGTWQLKVTDSIVGVSGTLQNWSLEITPRAPQGIELGALKFDLAGNLLDQQVFELAKGSIGADPLRQLQRSSNPTNLTVVNNRLYFTADLPTGTTTTRNDLWTSDGTPAGTFMVSSSVPSGTLSQPVNLSAVNDDLYFNAGTDTNAGTYKASVTLSRTAGLVSPTASPTPGSLTGSNQQAYFIVDGDFYTTDGSSAGTRATSSTQPAYGIFEGTLQPYNGLLVFLKSDGIYLTDGTDAGTPAVPTAVPSSGSFANPTIAGQFNGNLQIADGTYLYEFDGYSISTITSTYVASFPNNGASLASINGNLVFAADAGLSNAGIYSSSNLSAPIYPTSNTISNIIAVNGGIVFKEVNPVDPYDASIKFSSGSGTPVTLYEANAANLETLPGAILFSQGSLFFNSQIGTTIVVKIAQLNNPSLDSNGKLTGAIYVPADDLTANQNGATLSLANTINGLQADGEAAAFSGGTILSLSGFQTFSKTTTATGNEPWIISPSGELTLLLAGDSAHLKEINDGKVNPDPTINGSDPANFIVTNDGIYFSANDGSGRELYRYDFATQTTHLVLNVNPNFALTSNPSNLTVSGNAFYWQAEPSAFNSLVYADLPDPIVPPIGSITRLSPLQEVIASTGNTPEAVFQVRFNRNIDPSSVNPDDFKIVKSDTLTVGSIKGSVSQALAGSLDYLVRVDLAGFNPGTGTLSLQVKPSATFTYVGAPVDNFGGFQSGEFYVVNPPAPSITSLVRYNPATVVTTNASSVTYLATFSTAVDASTVNKGDFSVTSLGPVVGIVSVVPLTGHPEQFLVTVPIISGQGDIALSLNSNATIVSLENQSYVSTTSFAGEVYSIDRIRPTLQEVTRSNPSSTQLGAPSAVFQIKFSETVNPDSVNATSTFRASTGSVQAVSQIAPDTWLVTVAGLPSSGTVSLSMNPFAAVTDLAGNLINTTGNPSPNQAYVISPAPFLVSVNVNTSPNPRASSVSFTAAFSNTIDGSTISPSDFVIRSITGLVTGRIASTSTSGANVVIVVDQITGSGTFTVTTAANATITDTNSVPLTPPATQPLLGTFLISPSAQTQINKPLVVSLPVAGSPNLVEVKRGSRSTILAPFPASYRGGIVATSGDVNNDSIPDIIVAARQGASGKIIVYNGKTDQVMRTFNAFPGFNGQINIASGDVNADGKSDIIVGVGGNGPSHVKVFSINVVAPIQSFIAFPGYNGGVSIASADINGDRRDDIVVGTLGGTAPQVKVFSQGNVLHSFYGFEIPLLSPIVVAAGDLDGDGKAEVMIGSGAGIVPTVTVFSGARPGQAIGSFFAFPQNYRGGLTLTVQDYNNDGKLDILAGTAGGKNPQVRVFNGRTFRQIDSFFASVGGFAGPISLG
jgi:ELWxxDGT repeat protein